MLNAERSARNVNLARARALIYERTTYDVCARAVPGSIFPESARATRTVVAEALRLCHGCGQVPAARHAVRVSLHCWLKVGCPPRRPQMQTQTQMRTLTSELHARGTGSGLRTSSPCPCVCTYVRTRTRAFGVHIRTPTQRVPTPDFCWFVSRDSLRPLRTRYPSTLCMYVIAKCPPRCCTMLCIGRTPHRRRQRCPLSAFRCSLFAARA